MSSSLFLSLFVIINIMLRFLPRRVRVYTSQIKRRWCAHRLNIWKCLSDGRYCRRSSPLSDPAPDVGLHLCWMTVTHPDILASPESDRNLNVSSYSTLISIFDSSPSLVSSFSFSLFGGCSLPFIRCSSSGNRPSIYCSGRPVHFLLHVSKWASQQGLFIAADRLISCGYNAAQQLRVMSGPWTNILRQHLVSQQKTKNRNTHTQTDAHPRCSLSFSWGSVLFQWSTEGEVCEHVPCRVMHEC